LSIGFGDGRGSQPNASATALTTAIERGREAYQQARTNEDA
jgi:hypothetical protein